MLLRNHTWSVVPFFLCCAFLTVTTISAQPTSKKNILCTTFPIYQITRNVAVRSPGVRIALMLPPGMGCPHDYVLTPQDMIKMVQADALVINGCGMESFLGMQTKGANSKARIVDSSKGIHDLLPILSESNRAPESRGHKHDESGKNPHLFASPRMAARIAANIANELARIDTANAKLYSKNAKTYEAKLVELEKEFEDAGKNLKKKKIVTEHAIFDYLARDLGLQIVAVVEEEPGQEPSASQMLTIVDKVKKSGAAVVFIEPQYSAQVGKAIAKEAGVPVALLDPVATGPDNAPLDYYETTMRNNLKTLIRMLGYQAK